MAPRAFVKGAEGQAQHMRVLDHRRVRRDQLAAVASHADRAGRGSGPAADLGDLVENLTGYTLASDREETIFATLVADVRPAHVYRVPLLNSDVHNLIGLAEVADLLFAQDGA